MSPAEQQILRKLVAAMSATELRELCVEALRRAHRRLPDQRRLDVRTDLGTELVRILAARGVDGFTGTVSTEMFWKEQNEPWMRDVLEFLYWFERAGLGSNLRAETDILAIDLTTVGRRFLELAADHPLLSGWIERITARCPGIPDDAIALLVDARACLDSMLMRPAISLLGVSYELVVEHVFDRLVQRGALAAANPRAAARITMVHDVVDTVLPGRTMQERDNQFAAKDACNYAHALRRRRNDASHTTPMYGFDSREETEELVVSAGRHLPNLWRIAI